MILLKVVSTFYLATFCLVSASENELLKEVIDKLPEIISETIPETIAETAPEFELSDEEFDIQFAETKAKIENEGWEPEGEEELIAAEPAPEETIIAFDDDLGKGFCRRRKF